MYSPINYNKNYILPDYLISSSKSQKNNASKMKSTSLNSKKLILSRNENNSIKNLIMKTKTNNTNIYKPMDNLDNLYNHFSYENKSLNNHKKKEKAISKESLFRFISSKMIENKNHLNRRQINNYNNNNSKLYTTKLDFSMSYIKSLNKQNNEEKNKFNKYKGINKANKNYYRKILNFPLSPGNKNMKVIKLNNLNIHEVANSFNFINKEKDDIINKRILSSHNLFKSKVNEKANKVKSFIYNNTNNINLNVNIINKEIILNNFNNTEESRKTNNNKHIPKTIINKNNNSKNSFSSNNQIINNKENTFTPEEIHFQAVKYMQKIQNTNKNYF